MQRQEIPFSQELLRKGIHLISLSIPVIYIFVTKEFALSVLIPMAVLFIIFDLLMKWDNPVQKLIYIIFGGMLRPHERGKKLVFNGATWVLISAVATVLVFPKILAVTGFTILIISDISAALFGRKYGKHPLFTKSWEGTFAFFISGIIVVLILGFAFGAPLAYFFWGIIGAIAAGFAEAASSVMKLDDNLSIPVTVASIMWIGALIAQNFGQNYLAML